MFYKKISNFLTDNACDNLIHDYKQSSLAKRKNLKIIHGGRDSITSSSSDIKRLFLSSVNWKNLINKLEAKEFHDICFNELSINPNDYMLTNSYNSNGVANLVVAKRDYNNIPIGSLSARRILWFCSIKTLRKYYLKIKHFCIYFILRKFPTELLYDFSISSNGYCREVHRDSDSRLIIFLLYLNDLDDSGTGGELEIHEHVKSNSFIPAQPAREDCKLIDSIKPKAGELIIFKNTKESLHAVSEMKNHKESRYFIYGSFTLLRGVNPFLNFNNTTKIPTEFDFYE
tara:strand:+ start:175 stop:1032 length:858 start_codon:yes stop_codon:yes gene_type:complete